MNSNDDCAYGHLCRIHFPDVSRIGVTLYGDTVVKAAASQKKGCGFDSTPGALHAFPLSAWVLFGSLRIAFHPLFRDVEGPSQHQF